MTTVRSSAFTPRSLTLLAGTTIAASLLAGCGNGAGIRSASVAQPTGDYAKADRKTDKAIVRAELAVAKAPTDAAARAALGKLYLQAGRLLSAETSFTDAIALGDESGSTALGLALARIGTGRQAEAVVLLDQRRAEIPAADLGLALALAGETSRGVAILADAMRSGAASAKLRQNLAYAYALDGRWSEAKLMAAQDVPADQLDRRLAFWALSMLPDRNLERVAGLIGAPVRRTDPGQPAALALAGADAPHMAVAEPAVETPVYAQSAPQVELPATVTEQNIAAQAAAQTHVEPARPAYAPGMRQTVAQAFSPVLPMKARTASAPARRKLHVAAAPAVRPVVGGTHYVQLGAFATEQGARRAWGIYTRSNPGLAAFRMTITPATVKGKQIWRVAAGGLGTRLSATTLCSSVRSRGDACFAYAAPARTAPGNVFPAGFSGPQRARR